MCCKIGLLVSIPSFALLPYQSDFRCDEAAVVEERNGRSRRGDSFLRQ